MRLTQLLKEFISSEKTSGLILVFCTIASLLLTNFTSFYATIWEYEIANHHLSHWINDGLMAIFFLLIGLELEREIYIGELSKIKNAMLPIIAAIGGMAVPALLYFIVNLNGGDLDGIGIPMATDIAFALAVLSLLGNKVPTTLKIFLTALAVIDDLGAIMVIAVFYTGSISWINLGIALSIFVFLLILNRLKVHNLIPYLVSGVAMWYFMLNSGVHATITGVLLAFAIPFGSGDKNSPSYGLQHYLHAPVAYIILPLFALANTAILIRPDMFTALGGPISIGIIAGLLIGKPLGIFSFSYLAVRFKLTGLPTGVNWKQVLGTGFLGGIGFTMSIFITILAFIDQELVAQSKLTVMLTSLLAGITGFFTLKIASGKKVYK